MLALIANAGSINAVELLTADHVKLKKLFTDFERQHGDAQYVAAEETARQLCRALSIHERVEEEIFYAEARAVIENPVVVKEAKAEHAVVDALISRIMAGSIYDRKYAALVKVLWENVWRHMRAEEAQMFRLAQAADLDMTEIGARIAARRHDLEIESGAASRADSLRRRKAGARRKYYARPAERLRQAS